MDEEIFWFEDLSILLKKDNIYKFIPTVNMNNNSKLNAIVRFCIYLSVLLILLTNNINYIFIMFGSFIITYLIYVLNTNNCNIKNDIKQELLKEMDNKYKEYIPVQKDKEKTNECNNIAKPLIVSVEKENIEEPQIESNSKRENILDKQIKQLNITGPYAEELKNKFYKPNYYNDIESRKNFLNWCYNSSN